LSTCIGSPHMVNSSWKNYWRRINRVDEIEREVTVAERISLPASFDPLKQYLAEISRYPLLTRAEELRLAEKAYKYNDKEAARQIILSNLKLVVKIALG